VRDQSRQVLQAFAQRRHHDAHRVEAIHEILAKTPLAHLDGEVAVRRRDEAEIDRACLGVADAAHLVYMTSSPASAMRSGPLRSSAAWTIDCEYSTSSGARSPRDESSAWSRDSTPSSSSTRNPRSAPVTSIAASTIAPSNVSRSSCSTRRRKAAGPHRCAPEPVHSPVTRRRSRSATRSASYRHQNEPQPSMDLSVRKPLQGPRILSMRSIRTPRIGAYTSALRRRS
jgi:hypothetical protein